MSFSSAIGSALVATAVVCAPIALAPTAAAGVTIFPNYGDWN